MKIAIYGDSFGASYNGWPVILKNNLNAEIFHVYAEGGSSIDYSYLNFVRCHENYDLVIFLWTNEFRNSLIVQHSSDRYSHLAEYHSVHSLKYNSDYNEERYKRNRYQNLSGKTHLENFKYNKKLITTFYRYQDKMSRILSTLEERGCIETLKHSAMKDSVKYLRPDCINIRCFEDIFKPDTTSGISNIHNTELSNLNLCWNDVEEIPKMRLNHMSAKQNEEFASYLIKHIEDPDFDIHTTFSDPNKYYTMASSLEEAGFILK